MKKIFNTFLQVIKSFLFFIGIAALGWGIPAFHSTSLKNMFICIIIGVCAFGIVWLLEKYRRYKLSPEEKDLEDKEIETLKKTSNNLQISTTTKWLEPHIKENFQKEINEFVYDKLDEMIEKAPDNDTKIMLLKKKNEFLEEDISKLQNDNTYP